MLDSSSDRSPDNTIVGYQFRRPGLLAEALCHRSYCAENIGLVSNERLELLGDAVLGLVVTRFIFENYTDMSEGELAKLRASVVSSEALAEVAAEVSVGEMVMLGRGEEMSGGRAKVSILADTLEAVLGAIYLDGGLEAVEHITLALIQDRIARAATEPGERDYKTRLQELLARREHEPARYDVTDEGPDHLKWFRATLYIGDRPVGSGEGRSKKQAEQGAAREAWLLLSASASADGPASAGA